MVAQAGIENEGGKDELLRAGQKSHGRETEISEDAQSKYLKLPDELFLREHHSRHMKQRERNNKLGRDEAPGLMVKRLSGNARHSENCEPHHR